MPTQRDSAAAWLQAVTLAVIVASRSETSGSRVELCASCESLYMSANNAQALQRRNQHVFMSIDTRLSLCLILVHLFQASCLHASNHQDIE